MCPTTALEEMKLVGPHSARAGGGETQSRQEGIRDGRPTHEEYEEAKSKAIISAKENTQVGARGNLIRVQCLAQL